MARSPMCLHVCVCVCVSVCVFVCVLLQVHMARSLIKANKRKEAEDMLLDVIDNVIKSLGPHEQICGQAARMCWHIMHWQGRERRRDAIAMRVRLARLGCDVSECKYDARLHGQGQHSQAMPI